jgi:predicted RNA-binding protein YlxR (DUF448 family)
MVSLMTAGGARPRRKRAPQPKRVPRRTCVGCRVVQPKRQLVRLVRTAQGNVEVDPTGKAQGRGAYLHDRRQCWQAALASGALDHALKATLTEADRARLQAHGEQYANDD